MQVSTKRYAVMLFGLVSVLTGWFVVDASFLDRHQRPPLSDEWEERIRGVGGERAYAMLAADNEGLSPSLQHEKAHDFGRALYIVEGKPGLSVCDSNFSFGCFHEFLGTAIAAEGLSVAGELNEACFQALSESPLSCQHGIGHGVLAFLGYIESDLEKALSICETLPYADPIGGCYGGVFMEYNMRTMLAEEAVIRPIENDSLLYPCNELGDVYASACYFWQSQWWRNALDWARSLDARLVYERMGALCREAGKKYERPCFEGIGNNLPPDALFDAARARDLCDAAALTDREQIYCRSMAANSLGVGGSGMKGDAEAVCHDLAGGEYTYCMAYARNQLNIASPGLLP